MAIKKIPMRSCCGCREKKPKKELVRIVRSPNGEVFVDATSKMAGRGVYICNNPECLKKAEKSKALSRALECEIPSEVIERLQGEILKNE